MSGPLLPIYRWLVLDPSTGEPASGAKAYFYASGTSTPLDTYNNADLDPSHVNTNPVVAGADGVFPVIYLQNASYRVLVTTSAGTTIYPAQDNIYDAYSLWAATTQTANTVYAGPASGGAAVPTFRALVTADLTSAVIIYPTVVSLADSATPSLNASTATVFRLAATGNRTIAVPTNPVAGQKIVIQHYASGGARTLALNTGAGGFRFGTDIASLTETASGKTDYIGCIYNGTDSFWDVVAYVKGY